MHHKINNYIEDSIKMPYHNPKNSHVCTNLSTIFSIDKVVKQCYNFN